MSAAPAPSPDDICGRLSPLEANLLPGAPPVDVRAVRPNTMTPREATRAELRPVSRLNHDSSDFSFDEPPEYDDARLVDPDEPPATKTLRERLIELGVTEHHACGLSFVDRVRLGRRGNPLDSAPLSFSDNN